MSRLGGLREAQMDAKHRFETIDAATVAELVKEYPNVVPSKLEDLDKFRYHMAWFYLAERSNPGRPNFMKKDELTKLVDWKLSHGTFRPSLKALVDQNLKQTVESTTADAFSAIDDEITTHTIRESIARLTKLKGIGPATASLILSVFKPDKIPFFSDELFRWVFWEEGKAKGWDRPIKYSLKEYADLFEAVQKRVKDDSGLKALDLEQAAYVLGTSSGKKGKNASQKEIKQPSNDAAVKSNGKRKRDGEEEDPKPEYKDETIASTKRKEGESPTEEAAKNPHSEGNAKGQRTGTRSSARLKKS